MSKKVRALVTGLTGAAAAAAVCIVTYIAPANVVAINGAIAIASTAVAEICNLFTKEE